MWGSKSRHERGYDSQWSKVRKIVIERDKGLCQMCLAEGRINPGRDVDHKIPKAKTKLMGWTREQQDHPDQLWYLCKNHHLAKTEQEQGKTKHAPKPRIGADGWPISD